MTKTVLLALLEHCSRREDLRAAEVFSPGVANYSDGSEYPDGLRKAQIPVTVRVLQIVDVYDALITKRPYKAAMPQAEALRTMEAEIEKGRWDPYRFAEFREMLLKKAPIARAMTTQSESLPFQGQIALEG